MISLLSDSRHADTLVSAVSRQLLADRTFDEATLFHASFGVTTSRRRRKNISTKTENKGVMTREEDITRTTITRNDGIVDSSHSLSAPSSHFRSFLGRLRKDGKKQTAALCKQ